MKKNIFKHCILLFAFAIFTACGGKKNEKDEPVLAEARKIHTEAIQIHNVVMKDLKDLTKLKMMLADSLAKFLRKAEITKDAAKELPLQKQIEACDAQQKAMKEWMSNIQEVPAKDGEAHDHHDHEGHDHKPATQVSAPEMLAFQKEMLKNIQKIQQDMQEVLKK